MLHYPDSRLVSGARACEVMQDVERFELGPLIRRSGSRDRRAGKSVVGGGAGGGFTPAALTDPRTYLDPTDATTVWTSTAESAHPTPGSGTVGRVHDKSAQGRHLDFISPGGLPTYGAASDRLIFTGTQWMRIPPLGISGTQDFMVAIVFQITTYGSVDRIFDAGVGAGLLVCSDVVANSIICGIAELSAPYGQTVAEADGALHVVVSARISGTHRVYLDSVTPAATRANSNALTDNAVFVGADNGNAGGEPLVGNIRAIVVAGSHTLAEETNTVSYYKTKFGV